MDGLCHQPQPPPRFGDLTIDQTSNASSPVEDLGVLRSMLAEGEGEGSYVRINAQSNTTVDNGQDFDVARTNLDKMVIDAFRLIVNVVFIIHDVWSSKHCLNS